MTRVLIIDDEPNIRTTLARALSLEDYEVETAATGGAGLSRARSEQPDLVLLDLKLPDMSGLDVLKELRGRPGAPAIVMMSGHGTMAAAVQATRLGAFDFLEKPLSMDKLLVTLGNARRGERLERENRALKRKLKLRDEMVGQSAAMERLKRQIERAAPTRARVLIQGESGTGKELVARAIHRNSPRADKPFVRMNVAAIPSSLLESELFGHERGAFTGADKRYIGRFERANGGTLFLDEIGDMPLELQVKLLRVLQEGEIERIGGSGAIRIDVRVLSATHRDLAQAVEEGTFREDLYYRLRVLPLGVPALRERLDDVPLLARHFLALACEENGLAAVRFTDGALRALQRHSWPGNVRELGNTVERLAIFCPGAEVDEQQVTEALQGARKSQQGLPMEGPLVDVLRAVERQVIVERLERNAWHMTNAARDLGLERSHLYKKLRSLGIERPA